MLGKVTLTQLRLQVGVKESVFSHLFKYLSDFQMPCQPFKDPEFTSWLCRMRGANVRVSCVVELDDGKIEICGNPVLINLEYYKLSILSIIHVSY